MSEEREQKAGRLMNEEADVEGHMKSARGADESDPTEDVEAHVKADRQSTDEGGDD
jgi:hypothetical protein